jgi:hypothetical protein
LKKLFLDFQEEREESHPNIISENQNVFATGRELVISKSSGKFYGLDPEKAINYGLSFRTRVLY